MLWACHDCPAFICYSPDHSVPLPPACLCQSNDRQRALGVMAAPLLQVDSPYLIDTNCICSAEIVSPYLIICPLSSFLKRNPKEKKHKGQRYSFVTWFTDNSCKKRSLSMSCGKKKKFPGKTFKNRNSKTPKTFGNGVWGHFTLLL